MEEETKEKKCMMALKIRNARKKYANERKTV